MAATTAKQQFRFRICWCQCLQKVKVCQQTKFHRPISIDGWDITTSVFEKQTSAILEIYSRFRFRHLPEICTLFCIRLPNFVQIEAPVAEIWRHIHFSRWRPRRWILLPVLYLLMSLPSKGQSLWAEQILSNISNDVWDITTSGFEIQTSAILKFYFWFRLRPVRRNLHVILHQATELPPNRSPQCKKYHVISISQDGGRDR